MERKLGALGGAFIMGGLIIAAGALGGMEQQPDVPLYLHLLAAAAGLGMMFVGTRLIRE